MNFFKALFGSKPKTPEEDKKETEEHNFDVLKCREMRNMP